MTACPLFSALSERLIVFLSLLAWLTGVDTVVGGLIPFPGGGGGGGRSGAGSTDWVQGFMHPIQSPAKSNLHHPSNEDTFGRENESSSSSSSSLPKLTAAAHGPDYIGRISSPGSGSRSNSDSQLLYGASHLDLTSCTFKTLNFIHRHDDDGTFVAWEFHVVGGGSYLDTVIHGEHWQIHALSALGMAGIGGATSSRKNGPGWVLFDMHGRRYFRFEPGDYAVLNKAEEWPNYSAFRLVNNKDKVVGTIKATSGAQVSWKPEISNHPQHLHHSSLPPPVYEIGYDKSALPFEIMLSIAYLDAHDFWSSVRKHSDCSIRSLLKSNLPLRKFSSADNRKPLSKSSSEESMMDEDMIIQSNGLDDSERPFDFRFAKPPPAGLQSHPIFFPPDNSFMQNWLLSPTVIQRPDGLGGMAGYLKSRGMRIRRMPDDNDSLFRAAAHRLNTLNEYTTLEVKHVRNMIADAVEVTDASYFAAYLNTGVDLLERAQQIRAGKRRGAELELAALAIATKRSVLIYDIGPNIFIRFGWPYGEHELVISPIRLVYMGHGHFDSVEETPPSPLSTTISEHSVFPAAGAASLQMEAVSEHSSSRNSGSGSRSLFLG